MLLSFCFDFKAYLRRAIAHQGQGLNQEAKEDLSQLLAIEPNNKRAKVPIMYDFFFFAGGTILSVYQYKCKLKFSASSELNSSYPMHSTLQNMSGLRRVSYIE